jgi:hypothetical protein
LQHPSITEPVKRIEVCDTWDHLLEEIVSLITVKEAQTKDAPLKDLHSLRMCNKATKRATSSITIANHINLEQHY